MGEPAQSHRSLIQLLTFAKRGGHRVSRDIVNDLAGYGDDAVAAFEALLREPWPWDDDEIDAWWLRLHAVMAMGLIPTSRAGAVLLAFFERMAAEGDDELQDWLSGYWPAFLRNKPGEVAGLWRASALEAGIDFFARIEAVQVVLSLAEREGREPLERALDWVASIAADECAEPAIRALAGSYLLDFPRERFRAVMLGVAKATAEEHAFEEDDVIAALADGEDDPEWRRFEDPWAFYDPSEADRREERWAEEDLLDVPEPFVRDQPKVGRNDSCPCGSGRKFKRCCGAQEN